MLRGVIIVFLFWGVNAYGQDINMLLLNDVSNNTLWVALFTLLSISILYFLFSSKQIRQLKKEHIAIQEKYTFLEKNQHVLLENMGENIHHIAKQSFEQTSQLVEKTKKTLLHSEIKEVMHNENELLGATSDLIQFIQLKSKKITNVNEVCNFNHILNETIGLLSDTTKKHHTELIFDISKDIPNTVISDSSHLGQILVHLLKYSIQHSRTKKVRLFIDTKHAKDNEITLLINIEGNLKIDNKNHFFDSNYDKKSGGYTGLGLFIAKELVTLMEGELSIVSSKNSDNLYIQIPMKENNKDKTIYTLDKKITDKTILIVDTDNDSAAALNNRLTYFNMQTTLKTQEEFNNNLPNFANYDIIMLNEKLLTQKTIHIIELAQKKQSFKVIAIAHLYNSSSNSSHIIVDEVLYKPFSPEYIFELLHHLNNPKIDKKSTTLPIHKELFIELYDITLDDFSQFQGNHLLLVEDNFINQKLINSLLSKSNIDIDIVSNGQEALTFLEENANIDFILMDINMPIMDGFTATEYIRKDDKFEHVPIIALTALVADYEIVKMFSVGMNGYLSKPISIGKLYSAFNTFLEKTNTLDNTNIPHHITHTKLEGLDIKNGLTSMHDNITLYKEVLLEFISAYEKSDIVLDLLIKNSRYDEAQKLCLDIKGLADTIGAKEITELSNTIYNQLVYHKYDKLDRYSKRYATLLSTLKNSIEIYLKNER